jgi:hypothetical protein
MAARAAADIKSAAGTADAMLNRARTRNSIEQHRYVQGQ